MKIICSRTELNKALNNVSHSVPVRTTSNILEGILINAEDNKMKLTSTDTNMTTETVINVNAEGACEFVVPAKLFSAIISKLPEDDMMIDYDAEKSKINIKCAGSNSEIICFRGDEYPKIKLNEGENVIYLSKEDIKKLIKKTAFSASTDEFNRIITGVLLEIKDGSMKMVGVDPYRIATYKIEVDNNADVSVIIPAKLIIEVAKFIDDDGEDKMSFEIVDNKVILKFDNNKVILNTYSGKFIDYERILNKEGNINVRVKRNDLLRSTERASLLASVQNNNLIRFNIQKDVIYINSLNEEGNIEEKVEIINDGEDLNIGINSRYLKDALSVIDDEEVMINFKDSVSPAIIKPLKGDKYTYLILPIRMN
ncbi:MAG: DNA polymerase III subunit beta [Clostridiales bacterium]|jgi:DNA polymerase-3 subunit beta|nr:DNA polymerase III subunit beta [Clostridiales bacterium]